MTQSMIKSMIKSMNVDVFVYFKNEMTSQDEKK